MLYGVALLWFVLTKVPDDVMIVPLDCFELDFGT